jgi:uncharacterized protein YdcH (DUF465 family)
LEVGTMKQIVSFSESLHDRLGKAEARHRALDDRLKELGRRVYLTPTEQREISEIKKHKLRAKDEIFALRKEL